MHFESVIFSSALLQVHFTLLLTSARLHTLLTIIKGNTTVTALGLLAWIFSVIFSADNRKIKLHSDQKLKIMLSCRSFVLIYRI